MYRCLNCGRVFDEPKVIENHLTNDDYYTTEDVCPYCNNYFEEIEDED